jgi:hypothetical protein
MHAIALTINYYNVKLAISSLKKRSVTFIVGLGLKYMYTVWSDFEGVWGLEEMFC